MNKNNDNDALGNKCCSRKYFSQIIRLDESQKFHSRVNIPSSKFNITYTKKKKKFQQKYFKIKVKFSN